MSGLLELAERVEAATGPDRELDCLIWLIVGAELGGDWHLRGASPIRPDQIIQGRWMGSALEKWPDPENVAQTAANYCVPAFSASLDAAMSLVPEGWRTATANEQEFEPTWVWRLANKAARFGAKPVNGLAATPALAICSVALRARATNPGDGL